jgi:hypothetical protein
MQMFLQYFEVVIRSTISSHVDILKKKGDAIAVSYVCQL